MEKKKIAIALSGGVDSSLVAALLKEEGHDLIGITLEMGDFAQESIEDAAKVAKYLNIPHVVVNCNEIFQKKVIAPFIKMYGKGRTPNPCIYCNPQIKFKYLLDKALALGYDYIATGHYAQVIYNAESKRYVLASGSDKAKDQAYVLYGLEQEQLARLILPLADTIKADNKKKAVELGLPVAEKPESQEICFIKGDYQSYLKEKMPSLKRPGNIVDTSGQILGKHEGIAFYTIGQRKGLGIAAREPLYVVDINPKSNEVIVGNGNEVYAIGLVADELNWLAFENLDAIMEADIKIRYGAKLARAELIPLKDNRLKILFKEPQRAVTPGQGVVFYDGSLLLGGGIIQYALR